MSAITDGLWTEAEEEWGLFLVAEDEEAADEEARYQAWMRSDERQAKYDGLVKELRKYAGGLIATEPPKGEGDHYEGWHVTHIMDTARKLGELEYEWMYRAA